VRRRRWPARRHDGNNDQAFFTGVEIRNSNAVPLSIEHSNSLVHVFDRCRFYNTPGVAKFQGGSVTFDSCLVIGTSPITGACMFDLQPAVGTGTPIYHHGIYVANPQMEIAGCALVRCQATNVADKILVVIHGGDLQTAGMTGGALGVNYIEWDTAATARNILLLYGVMLNQGQPGLVCNITQTAANVTFKSSILGLSSYVNAGTLSFSDDTHSGGTVTITNTGTLVEVNVKGGTRQTSDLLVNGSPVVGLVAVSGTPTNGQIPIASSATAAAWATPAVPALQRSVRPGPRSTHRFGPLRVMRNGPGLPRRHRPVGCSRPLGAPQHHHRPGREHPHHRRKWPFRLLPGRLYPVGHASCLQRRPVERFGLLPG
jgi:hypothetical protein